MNRLPCLWLFILVVIIMTPYSYVIAGPAGESLFTEGVLASVADGSELIYEHRREGTGTSEALPAIDDGIVNIAVSDDGEQSREVVLSLSASGDTYQVSRLPASVGNPLLITFLESSLRAMAMITGGSPFYIRNRIKESLRDGGTLERVAIPFGAQSIQADQLIFRPFSADANRSRMGAFADLELRFIRSDTVPGGFLSMLAETAETQDGSVQFRERIDFRSIEGGS